MLSSRLRTDRDCLLGIVGVVVGLCWLGASSLSGQIVEGDRSLYELVKTAQARNRSLPAYEQGRLAFTAWHQAASGSNREPVAPVEARGQVTWRGPDKVLWVYKLKDPNGHLPGYHGEGPLDEAPTQYRLLDGETWSSFDVTNNAVLVTPAGRRTADSPLLDVLPFNHWFQCCPPNHAVGRPWLETIGENAPILQPDDRLSIEREGDLVRQTRIMGNGIIATTTFSLQWDGNVVEYQSADPAGKQRARRIQYVWGKDAAGVCVLRSCEATEFEPGKSEKVYQKHVLTIESVDLRPVSSSELSRDGLLSLLPRNVIIIDDVSKERYMAREDERRLPPFDDLAETLASEGFLNKKD